MKNKGKRAIALFPWRRGKPFAVPFRTCRLAEGKGLSLSPYGVSVFRVTPSRTARGLVFDQSTASCSLIPFPLLYRPWEEAWEENEEGRVGEKYGN